MTGTPQCRNLGCVNALVGIATLGFGLVGLGGKGRIAAWMASAAASAQANMTPGDWMSLALVFLGLCLLGWSRGCHSRCDVGSICRGYK